MKILASLTALVAVTYAAPAVELEVRQSVGTTENEFTRFGCRNVLFFFARGSTEAGNLVSMHIPPSATRF